MLKAELTLPEIALIAATRGLLGAGIALLLAGKLKSEQRNAIGWTLVGVGALTTIPLAIDVFSNGSEKVPSLNDGTPGLHLRMGP